MAQQVCSRQRRIESEIGMCVMFIDSLDLFTLTVLLHPFREELESNFGTSAFPSEGWFDIEIAAQESQAVCIILCCRRA